MTKRMLLDCEAGGTIDRDDLESRASQVVWDQMQENYYRNPKTGKFYTLISKLVPVTAREVRYNVRDGHPWFAKEKK